MKSLVSSLSALVLLSFSCAHEAAETHAPPALVAAAPAKPLPPAELAQLPGEELLLEQPKLAPLADFAAPVPKLVTLPNGLHIYLVTNPGAALESLAFVVKRGATSDPQGRAGLASLAAAMLEAGSGGRSQEEIASAADAIGATLHSTATTDAIAIGISSMPSHAAQMVALLGEVALRPNLDPGEFGKVQSQRVAELQAEMAEPRVAVGRAFAAALYGDSPLGRPALGTPASVQAIKLAEVKAYLATFSPAESALVAVGGANPDELLADLTKTFGSWKGLSPALAKKGARSSTPMNEPKIPPPPSLASLEPLPVASRPRLVFVDFKGRPQTVVRVGLPAVPRSSPDVLTLRLLNDVLGGSFTSRLNQNLREQHGYTYGAGTNFAFGRGPGPFAAATSVKTAVTGAALSEILKELNRVVTEPLSDAEVEKGKALLAYDLIESLQHSQSEAFAMAEIFVDDLPLDEYATFVPRLRAITAADVQAAARKVIRTGELTIALAGDEDVVLPQLAAAGVTLPAPEQRNALGEKVAVKR